LTATSHPNRRAQFDWDLRALCERAGVPYRSAHLHLHLRCGAAASAGVRHGRAVYALKQAQTLADYKAISQNMMHASLQTIDAVYAVLTPDDVGAHWEPGGCARTGPGRASSPAGGRRGPRTLGRQAVREAERAADVSLKQGMKEVRGGSGPGFSGCQKRQGRGIIRATDAAGHRRVWPL
jgi:hypothetical protein